MPLFECTQCHAVENTACTSESWWHRANGNPMRCSECADGEWHGLFPKKLVSETNYVTDAGGFLEPPGGWDAASRGVAAADTEGKSGA